MDFTPQEEFSYAYIHAITAGAGFSFQVATRLGDNSGVDATICAFGKKGTTKGRSLYLQVKSSYQNKKSEDHINYDDLDYTDYNALIDDQPYANPFILVLVLVPKNQIEWTVQSDKELCLRYSAYWLSLRGEAPITKSKRIKIPISQQLTVSSLQSIMQSIRLGGAP